MSGDDAFYDRALRRMDGIAVAIGVAAVAFFADREGWRGALGCAAAAAASIYNLRRLQRVAAHVAGTGDRPRAGAAVAVGLRYLLLAAGCFVIIRFLGISPPAIFAGLFVSVAAVLLEMVYELVFIR